MNSKLKGEWERVITPKYRLKRSKMAARAGWNWKAREDEAEADRCVWV